MHRTLAAPVPLTPRALTRGERRRKSLRRGIDLWHVDTVANVARAGRVALVALTVADEDPIAARGAIRDFWGSFRDRYGKRAYFSWAELQRRGAIHYHAMIVNPPWRSQGAARRWIRAHWPLASITPSYEVRDLAWFRANGGRYVKAYAKDKYQHQVVGAASMSSVPTTDSQSEAAAAPSAIEVVIRPGAPDKSYQQDYDQLPREIRTWECNRLSHPTKEVMQHVEHAVNVNTAPLGAPFGVRMNSWWRVAIRTHSVPPGARCTLAQKKTPLPKSSRSGVIGVTHGVHSTRGSVRGFTPHVEDTRHDRSGGMERTSHPDSPHPVTSPPG